MNEKESVMLKVASGSNPHSVGGSIAKNVQEGKQVTVSAIGAGAVNQAVKAVAIARSFLAPSGMDLLLRVGFEDVQINNEQKTAMKFAVVLA